MRLSRPHLIDNQEQCVGRLVEAENRLFSQVELETSAAGARPTTDERNRWVRGPTLGARDGLLGDSQPFSELYLGETCVFTDGTEQVPRHPCLAVRKPAPTAQSLPLEEGARPPSSEP